MRRIAYRFRPGRDADQPGVVWLGGFKSDMESTKALALDAFCAERGRACLRFDYSGHGISGGDFEHGHDRPLAGGKPRRHPRRARARRWSGSAPRWAAGSRCWRRGRSPSAGETDRIAGMVLIAPAVDFTEALLWPRLPEAARAAILRDGRFERPSAYSAAPYVYTRALIEDGRRHLLLGGIVRSYAPVRILQGMQDPDVPYQHAMTLVEHMPMDPVTLTLIRDGDHRLSREEDVRLLIEAVEGMAEG